MESTKQIASLHMTTLSEPPCLEKVDMALAKGIAE